MREQYLHATGFPCGIGPLIPNWDQDIIRVELIEQRVVDFWVAVHIQQAITFPMDIGQLRNHIALNTRMGTHVLDLELERIQLKTLAGFRQSGQRGKDSIQMVFAEAPLNAAWVNNSRAPFQPGVKPPRRAASISFIKLLYIRQAPVAKF